MTRINKSVLSLAVAGIFGGGASQAYASAFALIEQSASGLGNAYAGAAAVAEDASTVYYNPAGMTLLKGPTNLSLGFAYINISEKFTDSGSLASGVGLNLAGVNNEPRPLGGTGGDAGGPAFVPNFYVAGDIAPDWKFGLGISVPFGLKTHYEGDWLGRFQAVKSELTTLNINPSVAWKVNDMLSLGGGVSYQEIDAELSQNANYVAAAFAAAGGVAGLPGSATFANTVPAANAEGRVTISGSDGAWGFNLGAMIQATPDTRIGITYRSAIKYHVTGSASFDNAPAQLGSLSTGVSLDIKMPDSASIALQQKLGSSWTVLADATWTGWSKIKDLTIIRSNGTVLSSAPENFKDTYRYGVGVIYRHSDAWSFKAGAAVDQTPVNDTDRTPRLPDQDRTWISFGAKYGISNDTTLDVGYAHLLVKDASINQNAGSTTASGLILGSYKASIDIFGLQLAHRF
ncbi:MAG TPA: outer membrane protein transport protein [Burkholderiales bacterium]|nr:outer membrane protein transport protein [Burkholderiales bacterium]